MTCPAHGSLLTHGELLLLLGDLLDKPSRHMGGSLTRRSHRRSSLLLWLVCGRDLRLLLSFVNALLCRRCRRLPLSLDSVDPINVLLHSLPCQSYRQFFFFIGELQAQACIVDPIDGSSFIRCRPSDRFFFIDNRILLFISKLQAQASIRTQPKFFFCTCRSNWRLLMSIWSEWTHAHFVSTVFIGMQPIPSLRPFQACSQNLESSLSHRQSIFESINNPRNPPIVLPWRLVLHFVRQHASILHRHAADLSWTSLFSRRHGHFILRG